MAMLFVGLLILPIALLALVVAQVIARREPDPMGHGIYIEPGERQSIGDGG